MVRTAAAENRLIRLPVAAHDRPRKSRLRKSGHDGRVILDRVFLAVATA